MQPMPAQQPLMAPGAMAPPQPQKPRRRVLTSLPLEVFIFFGIWWDVFYYILNILVFIYKGACARAGVCAGRLQACHANSMQASECCAWARPSAAPDSYAGRDAARQDF